jgi:hypothetical protein
METNCVYPPRAEAEVVTAEQLEVLLALERRHEKVMTYLRAQPTPEPLIFVVDQSGSMGSEPDQRGFIIGDVRL